MLCIFIHSQWLVPTPNGDPEQQIQRLVLLSHLNVFICRVFNVESKKPHLHDLISCVETLLLSRAVLLNTGDEDTHIISSRQPQTHAVTFLETHHHRGRPARRKQDFIIHCLNKGKNKETHIRF